MKLTPAKKLEDLIKDPKFGANVLLKAAVEKYATAAILGYTITGKEVLFRMATNHADFAGKPTITTSRITKTNQPAVVALIEKLERGVYIVHGTLDQAALRADLDPIYLDQKTKAFSYGKNPKLIAISGEGTLNRKVIFSSIKEDVTYNLAGEPVVVEREKRNTVTHRFVDASTVLPYYVVLPRVLITTVKATMEILNEILGAEAGRLTIVEDIFKAGLGEFHLAFSASELTYAGFIKVKISESGEKAQLFDRITHLPIEEDGEGGGPDPEPELESVELTLADGTPVPAEMQSETDTLTFDVKEKLTPADFALTSPAVFTVEGAGATIAGNKVTVAGLTETAVAVTVRVTADGKEASATVNCSAKPAELEGVDVGDAAGKPLPEEMVSETEELEFSVSVVPTPQDFVLTEASVFEATGENVTVSPEGLVKVTGLTNEPRTISIKVSNSGFFAEAAIDVSTSKVFLTGVKLENEDGTEIGAELSSETEELTFKVKATTIPAEYVPLAPATYSITGQGASVTEAGDVTIIGLTNTPVDCVLTATIDGVSTTAIFKASTTKVFLESITLTKPDGSPLAGELSTPTDEITFAVATKVTPANYVTDSKVIYSVTGNGATIDQDGNIKVTGLGPAVVNVVITAELEGKTTNTTVKVHSTKPILDSIQIAMDDGSVVPETMETPEEQITFELSTLIDPENYIPVGEPIYTVEGAGATVTPTGVVTVTGLVQAPVAVTVKVELDGKTSSASTSIKSTKPVLESVQVTLKDGSDVPESMTTETEELKFSLGVTINPSDYTPVGNKIFTATGKGVTISGDEVTVTGLTQEEVTVAVKVELDGKSSTKSVKVKSTKPVLESVKLTLKGGEDIAPTASTTSRLYKLDVEPQITQAGYVPTNVSYSASGDVAGFTVNISKQGALSVDAKELGTINVDITVNVDGVKDTKSVAITFEAPPATGLTLLNEDGTPFSNPTFEAGGDDEVTHTFKVGHGVEPEDGVLPEPVTYSITGDGLRLVDADVTPEGVVSVTSTETQNVTLTLNVNSDTLVKTENFTVNFTVNKTEPEPEPEPEP